MKLGIFAVALMALGSAPVLAENDSGLYIGAGVGQFNVEIDNLDDAQDTVENFDSDDTIFKIFAGWRFNPYIGVELDYIDLGSPEDTVNDQRVKAEINGVAPYVIGTLPLGPVELFAKVGYYFYDIQVDTESIRALDDSSEDLVYGAGLGITLFEHLHARLEYEIIDISEVKDANALWLSGAWRF
ncbi:porin family protein [Povalibacter sp.]|uniref:porin family protein n=1 Tax=Povalibacter sp. TaxID=1962978 RepID=UPI002F429544